jgi:hypothetical protein
MSPSTNYAVARLRAERALVALHHQEAHKLRRERGYAPGTIELVARHRAEYRDLYRSEVARLDGLAGQEAGATRRFTAPLTVRSSGRPRPTPIAAGDSA